MSKKELVSYLLAQNTSLSPAQILLSLMAAVLLALWMYFVYRCCGANMYIIALLGSVVITALLFAFKLDLYERNSYLLLVCKLWQSPEFRQRFQDYAQQAYAENGIYGAENVKAALQSHFDQLEGQMARNLQRLYGSEGIESRMEHWHEQSEELYNFAEERSEYMLWHTNRACYEG